MSETGKSTTSARRPPPELRGRIDAYLLRVDAALTRAGATPQHRRAVLAEVRQRIMESLASRGESATAVDVDSILAELGPPDSHAHAPAPASPAPPAVTAAPAHAAPPAYAEPHAPPPPHLAPRRISLTALVAALWSLLFLGMVIVEVVVAPQDQAPPPWLTLIRIIGWTAPIATTVLGLIAIGRIQRSQGHLYGLSLALCCAMIFPLLLLDALIVWICWRIADTLMQQQSINVAIYRLIREIIPTIAVILADYFLVIQAWAAVQPERK